MKRFSFSNFLMDDSNREAFELCQEIAALKPCGPLPVTLLGDGDCGKTHLLYSIVNRVRTTSSRTGLAYVTAQDFPDPVRALIDDPSPVAGTTKAILLVDQLEAFTHLLEELEAVVRIFLDHGHYVVLASNVNPARLPQLTPGLRSLIESGRIVPILPRPETRVELLTRQIRQETEEQLKRQSEEIQELRTLLERVGKGGRAPDSEETAVLLRELEAERAAREESGNKLGVAKAYCDSLQHELTSVREELERRERNGERAQDALSTQMKHELESVRAQLRQAQTVSASTQQENLRLRADLDELSHVGKELLKVREQYEALRAELDETQRTRAAEDSQLETLRAENAALHEAIAGLNRDASEVRGLHVQARADADRLVRRVESLILQIESNQAAFTQDEEGRRRQIEELESLLAQGGTTGFASEPSDVEALRDRLAQLEAELASAGAEAERRQNEWAVDLAQARQDVSEARAECARLLDEQGQAAKIQKQLKLELDELKDRMEDVEGERDAFGAALQNALDEREALEQSADQAGAERNALRAALDQLRADREVLMASAEQLSDERNALSIALERSIAERDALRAEREEWVATRQELLDTLAKNDMERERLAAALDALRHEAAAQVAGANAQAGELEGRILRLRSSFDRTAEAVKGSESVVESLRQQVIALTDTLAELAGGLASAATGMAHDSDLLSNGTSGKASIYLASDEAHSHTESSESFPVVEDEASDRANDDAFLKGVLSARFPGVSVSGNDREDDALEPAELPARRLHPLSDLSDLYDNDEPRT